MITTAGEGAAAGRAPPSTRLRRVRGRRPRRRRSVVGWDLFDDVGVLRVDPRDHALDPVPLGDSPRVVVGEPVAAIGSPFGNENSLAVGVVSADPAARSSR